MKVLNFKVRIILDKAKKSDAVNEKIALIKDY